MLDWVKLADDGSGDLILRLYEAAGGRAEGVLHLTDELAQASIEETAVTESDALDPTLPTALAAAGTQARERRAPVAGTVPDGHASRAPLTNHNRCARRPRRATNKENRKGKESSWYLP